MTPKDKPVQTPEMWDSDAFLAKASRYLETMLEYNRDDWRFGLSSTFVLEHLARAALAKVSPTLLADPSNWNNLYHALGHTPTAKKFSPKSIAIADVLGRLTEILPKLDSELHGFSLIHINRRNLELHTGELPFDGVKHSKWLASFYRACAALLESMNIDLAQFLGEEEFEVATKLIEAAADDTAKAVAGTIKAHKTVWDTKSTDEQSALVEQAKLWATKHVGHRVNCPACGSRALVTGDPISAPQKKIDQDLIVETQQYLPSKFECIACGMKLAGLSHLSEAGVGDTFVKTQTYDAADYYAPEDQWSGFEDDNNEPY